MQRDDQHFTKAQRNEQFAGSLDLTDPTCESWAVIAVFYSALHYVQSYLSRFSVDAANHPKREAEIARDPKIKRILTQYQWLFTVSKTARYYCKGLPADPYRTSLPHLEAIKKQIEHALRSE